jgi:CRP-like cAMP-binding protein
MARDETDNLRQLELFSVFEPEALELLTMSAETQRLRAGDVLFRREEPSDGGYILTSGSIALQRDDSGGPAERIVRPLAILGEIALMAATRRPIGAIAREPSVALKISRAVFHEVLENYPLTSARVRALLKTRLADVSKMSMSEEAS